METNNILTGNTTMIKHFNLNLRTYDKDAAEQTIAVGKYLMYDGESLTIFKEGKTYSFMHYCDANGVIYSSKNYSRKDVLNAVVRYLCADTFPSKIKLPCTRAN